MTERTLDPPDLDMVLASPLTEGVVWAELGGEQVVVKTAVGRRRARLRREAEALSSITAPGLVEFRGVHEDDAVTAIVLSHAGHQTLGSMKGAGADVWLRALQGACEAVEALHQAGWVHGDLRADHVVVGARGRVRLCSLGSARPLTADLAAEDDAAMARLCRHVAEQLLESSDRDARRQGRRLTRVAARTDTTGVRSAALLARSIRDLRRGDHHRRPAPPRRLVVVGLALVPLVIGAGALTRSGNPAPNEPVALLPSEPVADEPAPAEAPTVFLDGALWRVGLPGDVAAIGEWGCDGTLSVRLLRPDTGELFGFDPPAGPEPVHGQLLTRLPGAVGLRVDRGDVDTSSPCDQLVVVHGDGTEEVLR